MTQKPKRYQEVTSLKVGDLRIQRWVFKYPENLKLKEKKIYFYFRCVSVFHACMYLDILHSVFVEARREQQIPWNSNYRVMSLCVGAENQTQFSARVTSDLNP